MAQKQSIKLLVCLHTSGLDLKGRSLESESSYVCDSCGEEIIVPIDFSEGSQQQYVEDCPVCCNPNVINVEVDEDGQIRVWGSAEQDRY